MQVSPLKAKKKKKKAAKHTAQALGTIEDAGQGEEQAPGGLQAQRFGAANIHDQPRAGSEGNQPDLQNQGEALGKSKEPAEVEPAGRDQQLRDRKGVMDELEYVPRHLLARG